MRHNLGIDVIAGGIVCALGGASLAASCPFLLLSVPVGVFCASKTFLNHPALTENKNFEISAGNVALALGDAVDEGFEIAKRPVLVAFDLGLLGLNILARRVK
jgi:hypothetical protein